MVALKANELQNHLKSKANRLDAYLVHGTDLGQISEIAKTIAAQLSQLCDPPGEILRLTEQDLSATPGRLASEARSLAMFGGRTVIMVKQGPQLQPAIFEELLAEAPLAAHIVVEAGNLKRDAKIRQIFEKSKSAAAIVCYGPDSRSIAHLIRDEVNKAGLTISKDAADRLTQLLGEDWAVSKAEIGKLILYAQGDPEITLDHVEAVVGDVSAHAIDAAINETLAGNAAVALTHLDSLVSAGTSPQVFLTWFGGHLQKLHAVLGAIDGGVSFDAAAAKIRPPLHFRQKDALKAQTARWRLPDVAAALALSHETLRQARLTPALEEALVADFILRISRGVKRKAA